MSKLGQCLMDEGRFHRLPNQPVKRAGHWLGKAGRCALLFSTRGGTGLTPWQHLMPYSKREHKSSYLFSPVIMMKKEQKIDTVVRNSLVNHDMPHR